MCLRAIGSTCTELPRRRGRGPPFATGVPGGQGHVGALTPGQGETGHLPPPQAGASHFPTDVDPDGVSAAGEAEMPGARPL
jgi:hypothetical protein